MFLAPVKKHKAYVSEIKTKSGKAYTVNLRNVHIQDIFHMKNSDGGYVLQVGVPIDSLVFANICTLDEMALQETLNKNKSWFQNSLSKDKISEYFRSSLSTTAPSLSVTVSENKEPILLDWHGSTIPCFDGIAAFGKKRIRAAYVDLVLEASGLYFYEKKFGVRWILKSARFSESPIVELDDVRVDREEIEHFWREEVENVATSLDNDVQTLTHKIEMLNQEKGTLYSLLQKAQEMEAMDVLWNDCLEELRDRVAKYRSGNLL